MKIGFDYWNVISHYPDELWALAEALKEQTHEVHVISAIGKTRIGTIVGDVLNKWPNFAPEFVHEVVFEKSKESPELKLARCKELGIEIFFDDRQDVCDLLNANGILAFKVPRANKSDIEAEIK